MSNETESGPKATDLTPEQQLRELRDKISGFDTQLVYLNKYQDVMNTIHTVQLDIQDIKQDIHEKWLYFKLVSLIITIAFTLLGVLGYHNMRDIQSQITDNINSHVTDSKIFYDNLMAGTALTVQKNYTAATPILKKCLTKEHLYDNSVLFPLLLSLNYTDNWEEALPVIETIMTDRERFDKINDASIYLVVGSILVQAGVSRWTEGIPQGRLEMDQGLAILQKAKAVTTREDHKTLKHLYNNEWIYYLAVGDPAKAQQAIEAIKALPNEQVYSWDNVSKWRCFRDLFDKHPEMVNPASSQWGELKTRYMSGG
jgi:hypothetical protein